MHVESALAAVVSGGAARNRRHGEEQAARGWHRRGVGGACAERAWRGRGGAVRERRRCGGAGAHEWER